MKNISSFQIIYKLFLNKYCRGHSMEKLNYIPLSKQLELIKDRFNIEIKFDNNQSVRNRQLLLIVHRKSNG